MPYFDVNKQQRIISQQYSERGNTRLTSFFAELRVSEVIGTIVIIKLPYWLSPNVPSIKEVPPKAEFG